MTIMLHFSEHLKNPVRIFSVSPSPPFHYYKRREPLRDIVYLERGGEAGSFNNNLKK
jgi:hypothetical protein